ncbi:V-type ATP synthase subunit D [Salinirubrum litoreum]|uniref:A-type ATP synthase subunit D n=1 Tax=Salinirubrum litoreum TaxID=1126234 RepID=A0ABD5RFF3_9EURY|nr:V-type ATP synthase subunit D [Salinirubrum litoreum]
MTRRRGRVAPTHHELLNLQREIKIATKGVGILRQRRDGLVFVLLDLLDRWRDLQHEMDAAFRSATRLHDRAMEQEGESVLRPLANSRSSHPELLFDETKLLGLPIPMILSDHVTTPVAERGYGLLGTTALDDAVVSAFEMVLELVIRIAEFRLVLSVLLAEIRRLRVRVNYLERYLLPNLDAEREYVQRYLNERDREERYRQFRAKRRKEERREATQRRTDRRPAGT